MTKKEEVLARFVRLRGELCTLRNQFDEALSDLEDLADSELDDLAANLSDIGIGLEEAEGAFDDSLPLNKYPSVDPATWSV